MSGVVVSTPSKRMGNFEVVREIGQGGMGVVYLARQPALERLVVLKKLRRELLVDSSMLERFQREARAAAAVHHQNVVGVYDCFEARGDHYIAQEFVEGQDLRSILVQLGRLDPEVAALIALEVARGLEEIHARGIVHRDLKPGNVLIGSTGETKIADFGIAVEGKADGLTRPGTLVGSIPYMAPEQILGLRADQRSDVFLFGILLFEMIVGTPPYQDPADDLLETLLERMQDERYVEPRRIAPGTPRCLARLIRGCLRARPALRIPTATVLRRSLERMLGSPSTHDCRGGISLYLWEQGVFRAAEGRTAVRKVWPRRGRIATRRYLRWASAAAAGLVVALTGLASHTLFFADGEARRDPAASAASVPTDTGRGAIAPSPLAAPRHSADVTEQTPPPAPAAARPEPARVRFVADPWAEVRVDGATSFFTPRAAPLELEPGSHRVVFEHPTFGRAEVLIDLGPGEARTLRHVFARGERR